MFEESRGVVTLRVCVGEGGEVEEGEGEAGSMVVAVKGEGIIMVEFEGRVKGEDVERMMRFAVKRGGEVAVEKVDEVGKGEARVEGWER